MKKLFLALLAFLSLGIQSCSNDKPSGGGGVPKPLELIFLVKKNSQEYKDMMEAFSKSNYTKEPQKERGYNNIYFIKEQKKFKVRHIFNNPVEISEISRFSYERTKINEEYAFFIINYDEFLTNSLTGKEESLTFVYDDKEIPLKIKGDLFKAGFDRPYAGTRALIKEFYVNDKKHRFINYYSDEIPSYDCFLYLVE